MGDGQRTVAHGLQQLNLGHPDHGLPALDGAASICPPVDRGQLRPSRAFDS